MKFLGFMILLSLAFICTAGQFCNLIEPCDEGFCCSGRYVSFKRCKPLASEGDKCDNFRRKYCNCAEDLICVSNDDMPLKSFPIPMTRPTKQGCTLL
ncbi:uncharacterized protein [Parasteatoda tepidariorum]|uniref:uncharacterized protein isoform X2 n=1 Tax=Parasteatoda tepidariorum TaxID=114398 RepID=UPI0039BD504E